MGHYSCLFGRQLNLSSEYCTIAERVATHISHIAVRAFLDFTDHLPTSVSDSIRSLLSQISQCSPPVRLTSPEKNTITQAKSITQSQSEIASKSTQDIRSKTLKYLLSSTSLPPSPPSQLLRFLSGMYCSVPQVQALLRLEGKQHWASLYKTVKCNQCESGSTLIGCLKNQNYQRVNLLHISTG